jgi:hypothetical protein
MNKPHGTSTSISPTSEEYKSPQGFHELLNGGRKAKRAPLVAATIDIFAVADELNRGVQAEPGRLRSNRSFLSKGNAKDNQNQGTRRQG